MANAVVDAIRSVAGSDPHVLAAMLMGSSLESNWNTQAVGDHGKSFGIFQIYTVAHPNVSAAQAQDPVWAAKFMLPAYQAGVAKVAPALWQSNPALASAQAAFYAERPAKMYTGYDAKWSAVQAALAGADISGPVTGTGSAGGATLASDPLGVNALASGITDSFTHGIMTFANMMLFFTAGMLGLTVFTVGVGFIFLSSPMGQKVVDTATKVVGAGLSATGPAGAAAGAVIRSKGVGNKASTASNKIVERRQQQQQQAKRPPVEGVKFKKPPEKSENNG